MTVAGGRADHWAEGASGIRNSHPAPTDPAVMLPRLSEKLEITGRHAEGATCEVFKAHHVALDIGVAVKVLRPEYVSDPRFRERMRIEAQVLPRLRSRHIVQCFDRGFTEDGRPFTVLEFLRGETLETLLEKLGRFDEASTVEVGSALLEALSAAHSRGIVHRDVSLRNLIVHRSEHEPPTLKLIDFGFACILPGAPESAPEPAEKPDRDSVGTPRFMSPEVARGRTDIDGRADLYSTGVVLYWLLAGRDPFAELRTPEAVLEAHAHRTVPRLSLYARGISNELESVVMRLLERDRASRYASAQEAQQALLEADEVARNRTNLRLSVPPAGTARPMLAAGEPCGPYVVKQLIGSGSFSETYEVEAAGTSRKRPLALEITKREFAADARTRTHFLEAARRLSTIRHPNFATVYHAGEHDGCAWIATDLVEGCTLRGHLTRERKLAPAAAIKLAYGIAGALRQIHRLGLVYGALEPEHVLVTPAGEACLIHGIPLPALSEVRCRAPDQLLGAAAYQPPESLAGTELDAHSDIYSWGLIVFEMLTGRHADAPTPHSDQESLRNLLQRADASIPKQNDVAPHLPERLWHLLEAATQRRAALRPANFSDVCALLDDACDGIPFAAPLALTHEHAVVVNGDVLVQLWRAPTAAGVRVVREVAKRAVFCATLVVVEGAAALPNHEVRRELAALADELAARVTAVAVVLEGQAFGGAGTRAAVTHAGFVPNSASPCGVFTSLDTAVEWLGRYHMELAGLANVSAVLKDLRRRVDAVLIADAGVGVAPATTTVAPTDEHHERMPPSALQVPHARVPTLVARLVGSVVVLRESSMPPFDDEWDVFLSLLASARQRMREVRVLVVTDGGGPNGPQRRRLATTLRGTSVRAAGVTDSARAKFIGAIISLFNPDFRSFRRKEVSHAHDHLGLTEIERKLVDEALAEMDPLIRDD
jgi:serine/threonine protein kinase